MLPLHCFSLKEMTWTAKQTVKTLEIGSWAAPGAHSSSSLVRWRHSHFLPFQLVRKKRKWGGTKQNAGSVINVETLRVPRWVTGDRWEQDGIHHSYRSSQERAVYKHKQRGIFLLTDLFPSNNVLLKVSVSMCIATVSSCPIHTA